MTLLKIAFRNVLKNRRRSLITTLAIALGFMAVAMFHGYNHYSYRYLKEGAVRGSALAHYSVFKEGYNREGRLDPVGYLLSGPDLALLQETLAQDPEVELFMPQIWLSGLVSNGDVSQIFLADALVPGLDRQLLGQYSLQGTDGLDADKPHGVLVGSALFDLLRLERGANVVLMGTTAAGQMNAVDAEVLGTYDTTSEDLNDKYLRVPVSLAQALLDTEGATRVVVLLRDDRRLGEHIAGLKGRLSAQGLKVEIRRWDEMSVFYTSVKDYLDAMFLFVNSIVGLIVTLSVVNTVSMSVMERVREIGTLRAMGMKPAGTLRLFACEGAILGFLGGVTGTVLTAAGIGIVSALRITYKAPGLAYAGQLLVDPVPGAWVVILCGFTALATAASAFAARKGNRLAIVDALGHT